MFRFCRVLSKIKVVWAYHLLGTASAQFFNTFRNSRQQAPVDHTESGRSYHFSWRHPELGGGDTKMTWNQARTYCENLPDKWLPISINNRA